MATFNVGIGKDDIQEGVLLPEDWYTCEISREPYEDKNSAWKTAGENLPLEEAAKSNPKVGKNIVVNLKVVSETPDHDGRGITKWLPLPNALDEGLYMNDGQEKAHWKAETVHKWVEAFGGASEGAEVSLAEGQKALVYIVVGKDQSGEEDQNAVSMNVAPRSLTAGTGPLGDEGESPLDDGLLT